MKRYTVTINGIRTTLLLSDADAEARGLTAEEPKAKAPANKSRQPSNKRAEAASKAFGS